jgi:hypothetical protein
VYTRLIALQYEILEGKLQQNTEHIAELKEKNTQLTNENSSLSEQLDEQKLLNMDSARMKGKS